MPSASDRAEGVFRQVGQCLRKVHAITGEGYGYAGAHRPMEPQSDWPSAFAIMWNRLLDDIWRCGGYSVDETDFLRRLLDQHFRVFDHGISPSLLHMDIWAQNILADEEGHLTGLLDSDRALWGDPEIEFAVLDYCGIAIALQLAADQTRYTMNETTSSDNTTGLRLRSRCMPSLAVGRRVGVVLVFTLTGAVTMKNGYGIEFNHREAVTWQCEEWTLRNASWSGNPFDVIAEVSFVHSHTGVRRITQMFYAGNKQWKFRFTGTRTGMWTFSTASADAELDGHTGSVTVNSRADPDTKGFLTHVGNKYAIMVEDADDLEGYVYQVFMNQQDYEQQHEHSSRILGHPSRSHLIADYWNNTRENGFDIYFFAVFYSWFRMGALSINDFSDNADPELDQPDPALFDTLERAIRYAHERGGRTHIWAWGDNDRKQTPNHLGGGFRGERHRRLIRYIAARLGPLPGWSMNFGFDTIEMPNAEADTAWWADEMNRAMGWKHILTSRGWADDSFGANSYAGFGGNPYELETTDKGPAGYREIMQHMEADGTRPSIYEERHTYNRWKCWPDRVPDPNRLDEPGCRRLIWWETMAGGMGGFFGHFSERFNRYGPFRSEGPCGYHPDSLKRAFRTHRDFWKNGRLRLNMAPDNGRLTGAKGYCLAAADKKHIVIFVEDAGSVTIDLRGMPGSQPCLAVDAKADYREIDRGILAAGVHTVHLDHTSDWVLAIGDFDVPNRRNAMGQRENVRPPEPRRLGDS